MPIRDFTLHWKDWQGRESEHRVRLFGGAGEAVGKIIMLATEGPDAVGVSVTNGCESIATLVCRQLGLEVGQVIFIEHYQRSLGLRTARAHESENDFARVRLAWDEAKQRFRSPQWRRLTVEEATALCGETIS